MINENIKLNTATFFNNWRSFISKVLISAGVIFLLVVFGKKFQWYWSEPLTALIQGMYSMWFWVGGILTIGGFMVRPLRESVPSDSHLKVRDVIFFILSLPILLALFHDAVICTLVPQIGIAAGDAPGCTLGWNWLFVFVVIPFWAIWFLFISVWRFRLIHAMRSQAKYLYAAYILCFLIPAFLLLLIRLGF